jgi:cell wall-associated NlpC family hydrolase
VPYSWGGGNAYGPTYGVAQGAHIRGFDCSGLMLFAYAHAGVQLDHWTGSQWNAGPHIVDKGAVQPGDLVFYASTYPSSDWITHVGIYVGNGQQINAPTEGQVVSIQPVFSGFWGAHYAGAGRVQAR